VRRSSVPWWLLVSMLVLSCANPPADTATTTTAQGSIPVTTPAIADPTSTTTTSTTATSTTATSTTATTVAPDVAGTIVEWLTDQRAKGLDQVIVPSGWSTREAIVVTAFTTTPRPRGDLVVALADGRVATLPTTMQAVLPPDADRLPQLQLTRLAGDPLLVLVADDGVTVVASQLDPDTLTWTDLTGLSPLVNGERLEMYTAGDHALAVHRLVPVVFDQTPNEIEQWGELISPDGTVTRLSDPPEDTPIWFTNDAGGRAFLLGFDTAAQVEPDLPAPVAFDPVTNSWTVVPAPEWVDCTDGCWWGDRHEFPDPQFFRTTPAGIVAWLPGGTYGLLDPTTLTWRRMDDPPIPLPGPIVVAVGNDRLMALPGPTGAMPDTQSVGIAAWLDLTSGTWSTQQIIDPAGRTPPVWWEPRWWGDVVLLGYDSDEVGNPPLVAIDLSTGETRAPTQDELTAWPALIEQMPIDDLITTWGLRLRP
jgi:hypothetical protein